ncbi:TonB-dependent receptor plug domain-containing protein [Sphingobacterium daejeonense]|uniref:TonB-dependent receptor plug domain-containing protein n=1 Tax=Sphingobacterium daejeonense TaxID=371142 RepID=UPI0010C2CFBD|nr:TonB-dependent receptor plug domain-containing protein [Sphingobacterium daejeonense]VTP97865.1 Outer membrane receptor for ferrienterochelin and colicins [Sphingobacterium daejeonense]
MTDAKELTITLSKSSEKIHEVYVLAQQNYDKSYETTLLEGAQLINSFESNPINSLRARVPGLQMNATAGGVTSGTGMVIRGMKSIVGGNQPLFVIDGMPIENETSGANQYGGQDWGNSLKELNIYDIDHIQVLKSAAASQKYGSRGMNGVIEILTKGQNINPGLSFDVNLGGSKGNVYGMPLLLSQEDINQINDSRLAWLSTASDNYYQSFEKSNSQVAQIAVNYSKAKNKFRLSYGADYNKGSFIRNTLDKNNLMFKGIRDWSPEVQTILGAIYNHSISRNAPSIGAQKFASLGRSFIEYPVDFATVTNNDPLESETAWYLYGQQAKKTAQTVRLFLNNSWKINEQLNFNISANYSDYNIETKEGANGYFERLLGSESLYHQQRAYNNQANEYTRDWMTKAELNYNKSIQKHQIHLSVGYDYWQTEGGIEGQSYLPLDKYPQRIKKGGEKVAIDTYLDPSKFSLANAFNIQHANNKSIHGAIASANYQYGPNIFVNIAARYDHVNTLSNLEKLGSLNKFYPSVGVSYLYAPLINKWLGFTEKTLNFAKIRANYAHIGNVTGLFHYQSAVTDDLELPYPSLKTVYKPYYTNSGSWGLRNYQTGFSYEYAKEYELGTDLSLYANRLNLHVTWYNRVIDNYLYDIVSPLEQMTTPLRDVHAKVRNRGWEIQLNAIPVQISNFSWSSTINFSANQNKFLAINSSSPSSLNQLGTQNDVSLVGSVNGNFGTLLSGFAQKTNDKGQPLLNSAMEYLPSGEAKQIGNTTAKWIAGFENKISFKNFQISGLLDFKVGGDIYSGTHGLLYQRGVLADTRFGRSKELGGIERKTAVRQIDPETGIQETVYKSTFDGIIPEGVFDQDVYLFGKNVSGLSFSQAQELIGKDELGEHVLQPVSASDYYAGFHDKAGVRDRSVFENSYIALREITLGYTMPTNLAQKWFHADLVQIGVVGRNLGYLYKSLPFNLNPDGSYNNRNAGSFEYAALLPVRTYGMFLKLNF